MQVALECTHKQARYFTGCSRRSNRPGLSSYLDGLANLSHSAHHLIVCYYK